MRPLLLVLLVTCAACRSAAPPPCETRERPVVFVHGMLAAGDTWATQAQRFVANGHCADRLFAFDWDPLGREDAVARLDGFVDAARATAGADRIDLVGHSAGGGLAFDYLADPARAAKVAHYAHVGSVAKDGPAGPSEAPVPTLNLTSEGDRIVPGAELPGATNVRLTAPDHYEVATGAESFDALWTHFHDGRRPRTDALPDEETAWISGRVVTLGENAPRAGARVEMWAVDAAGARLDDDPEAVFTADADGEWGPFEAAPALRYELVALVPDELPVRYFREPFRRSNRLVYLRTLPAPTSIAGSLLAAVKFHDAHSVVVVFSANRGLVAGADSLTVNAVELATAALAAPERTLIAAFAWDDDLDGMTDAAPVPALGSLPFLGAMDVALPPSGTIAVRLNGRALDVPGRPSDTDGPSIVVFE